MHEQCMNFNKEVETIKKSRAEILQLKNTVTELKIQQRISTKILDQAEEPVNSRTDNLKLTSEKNKRKKNEKYEERLQKYWTCK